ncbi:MAG: hypothetical protein OXN17_18780 [Candidatus Poribacteria bacterium]|nr:hypothetical protein [Candidatus Poribacteria bacterium]MDE0506049.1 hypothetical protein [Candidatus Poribacteria bacterium]
MSHVLKDCSRRCLQVVLIALACSALLPVGCGTNKNLRALELNSILNELGESEWDYLAALWPSDEELSLYRASLSIVPPDVVEGASSEIRTYIKKEWLPANLENRLIPMKDWVRTQRFGTPTPIHFEYEVDVLIAEFSTKGYNVRIQDFPYAGVGVLISPVKPNEKIADIEDYIGNSISTFLNFPPSKLGNIEYMLNHTQNGTDRQIFCGKLTCEWNLDWDGVLDTGRGFTSHEQYRHRKWWNSMTVCSDGYSVFLCIRASTPEDYVKPTPTARIDDFADKSRF